MNELTTPPAAPTAAAPSAPKARSARPRWTFGAFVLVGLLAAFGLGLSWNTLNRLKTLEQDFARRQQDSQGEATEARALARQAQDLARETAAKAALLEARVAEASLQRTQLEDLIQSFSRSRDENVVADVEAALRVAMQQSALTGSAEPLITALRQADERLARYNQPRLERVRRAVARDLDNVKAIGVVDISTLTMRLDDAVRQVDEIPLLADARRSPRRESVKPQAQRGPATAPASAAVGNATSRWSESLGLAWQDIGGRLWDEVRTLVRVTAVEHPDAALVSPEQAFFIRENLKLRLLNARLALLSRQFDTLQSDLRDAQSWLDTYFDRSARRLATTTELLRQVAAQAKQTGVPRPDETLAALAAVASGR